MRLERACSPPWPGRHGGVLNGRLVIITLNDEFFPSRFDVIVNGSSRVRDIRSRLDNTEPIAAYYGSMLEVIPGADIITEREMVDSSGNNTPIDVGLYNDDSKVYISVTRLLDMGSDRRNKNHINDHVTNKMIRLETGARQLVSPDGETCDDFGIDGFFDGLPQECQQISLTEKCTLIVSLFIKPQQLSFLQNTLNEMDISTDIKFHIFICRENSTCFPDHYGDFNKKWKRSHL